MLKHIATSARCSIGCPYSRNPSSVSPARRDSRNDKPSGRAVCHIRVPANIPPSRNADRTAMPRRSFLAATTGNAITELTRRSQQMIAKTPKIAPGFPTPARQTKSITYRSLTSDYHTNAGASRLCTRRARAYEERGHRSPSGWDYSNRDLLVNDPEERESISARRLHAHFDRVFFSISRADVIAHHSASYPDEHGLFAKAEGSPPKTAQHRKRVLPRSEFSASTFSMRRAQV